MKGENTLRLKREVANFFRYLVNNWRAIFAFSAISFVFFHLLTAVSKYSVYEVLEFLNNAALSVGISTRILIATCFALAAYKPLSDFWKRYRSSYQHNPHGFVWVDGVAIILAPLFAQWLYYILLARDTIFISGSSGLLEGLMTFFVLTYVLDFSPKTVATKNQENEVKLFPDDPIRDGANDLLERSPFIARIKQLVLRPPSESSFVVGLYGKWGSGKTSVINLLKKNMTAEPVLIYEFDPWFFENKSAIIKNFYFGLERLLRKHYLVPVRITNYLKIYPTILIKGFIELSLRSGFYSKESRPTTIKNSIEQYIGQLGRRLVVIVDDIDRLEREEILTVFRLVRLSARATNIVFLLAFDPENVIKTLSRDDNDTSKYQQYLEKIIQAPIHLPMTDQKSINDLLFWSYEGKRSLIDQLLDRLNVQQPIREEFDKKFIEIYESHLRNFFSTFRRVYLFMNSLTLRLPSMVNDVYLFDFHILEVLHTFFPTVYIDIEQNKHIYASRITLAAMAYSSLPYDNEQRRQVIKTHVERVLEQIGDSQRSLVLHLMQQLFPSIQQAFEGRRASGEILDENIDERDYRVQKRIAHPDNFDRYFMLQYRKHEVQDSQMEAALREWESSSDKENAIGKTLFAKPDVETYTRDVLQWLKRRIDKIPDTLFIPLIEFIYKNCSRFKTKGPLWETEIDDAEALLLLLINESKEIKDEDVQPLLEKIITEASGLDLVTHLVFYAVKSKDEDLNKIRRTADNERLRQLAAHRLKQHFIDGGHDVFSEYSGRNIYRFVIYQWSSDWKSGNDHYKKMVTDYVIDMMRKNPPYVGMYLAAFVEGLERLPDRRLKFNYDSFAKHFDVDTFYSFLSTFEGNTYANQQEKDAIEQFISVYQEQQK